MKCRCCGELNNGTPKKCRKCGGRMENPPRCERHPAVALSADGTCPVCKKEEGR